jgi:phospholipid/cholesterol/gamma-HCH transport system substrate-binding protein
MKLSKEFKVGLFMVIAITLLYFGFNFLKGIDFFSSNNRYYAIYENVDKLTPSNQVFLSGYAVGRVSRIEIQQDKNRVLVELDIDNSIKIYSASKIMLNGDLLGARWLQLNVVHDGRELQPNDTIPSDVAKGLLDFLAENAEPVAATLQTTLKKVNVILDNLTMNTQRLDTVFKGLQPTPRLLNRTLTSAGQNINELSASMKTVAGNLNGTLNELKPTLANFRNISDSLKNAEISGTIKKAQASLAKLNETLNRLNKGDNTVSKLLTEDSLYVNMNKLMLSVDSLARHFNDNPRHFLSPLGKSSRKIQREKKAKK